MKRHIFYLLTLLFVLLPLTDTGAQEQGLRHATAPVEKVTPDSARYESFKKNPDFDYYSLKLEKPRERNWLERLYARFINWLLSSSGSNSTSRSISASEIIFLLIGVGLVIGFVTLLLIYKPSFFFRNKNRKTDSLEEDDNIYGRNFDKLIEEALKNEEYNDAIRWRFLQILRKMEDMEIINWNPNKTVIEYTYEIKNAKIKDPFKDLCWHFLYFRYGNFEATKERYLDVDKLAKQITDTLES